MTSEYAKLQWVSLALNTMSDIMVRNEQRYKDAMEGLVNENSVIEGVCWQQVITHIHIRMDGLSRSIVML